MFITIAGNTKYTTIFTKRNVNTMRIRFILFLSCIQSSISIYGQSEESSLKPIYPSKIGITASVHESGFYGRKEQDRFYANHQSHWSYATGVYYKEPVTKYLFAGFELENLHVRSNLEYSNGIGVMYSYTFNALLDLDYLNFHFLFGGRLISGKRISISATLSPYFGYLVHSKAAGYETKTEPYDYTDSLGQTHVFFGNGKYDLPGTNVKQIRKANIGQCLSLDVEVTLTERLQLLLKASYNQGIFNVISEDAFIGIRGAGFSAGVAYLMNKKYINFSKDKHEQNK